MGRVSLRRFAALAASALLAPACASWFTTKLDPPAGQRLEDAWRLYRISEDAKAMAIAIDPASGQRVWGIVYGSLDQDSASRNALKECEENARAGGVAERCHLFAIGNRRAPSAVAACAEGRAYASFCALMNDLIPPTPQEPPR
jgi:hypothetical protein